MKKTTLLQTLTLAVGLLATATTAHAQDAAKPAEGNLVIGKVYYARSKQKADNKNYTSGNGQFIEIYNNSANVVDAAGLYIGLVEADSHATSWNKERMQANHPDSITMKQVFRIAAEGQTLVQPGQALLVVNSAIDHSDVSDFECNLTGADLEAKSSNYPNADGVQALQLVYSAFANIPYMLISQAGPCAIVLFVTDQDVSTLPKTYPFGKDKGNQNLIVPKAWIIDGMEILATSGGTNDPTNKHLYDDIDQGYLPAKGFSGERFYRKTRSVTAEGRIVLWDTNNSTIDFATSTTIQPRAYDADSTALVQTITIPSTGHLPIKPGANFQLPEGVTASSINASANSTELRFTNLTAEDGIISSSYKNGSAFILTAQPGTYELTLTNAPQTRNHVASTATSWIDATPAQAYKKNRKLYKFVNEEGHVGFARDENYKDNAYQYCDLSESEHLYLPLPANGVAKIAETLGTTADALDFIAWTGPVPSGTVGVKAVETSAPVQQTIFDLQGRRVNTLSRPGLYIRNGKKVVVK